MDGVPLEKYIVKCETNVQPPIYLRQEGEHEGNEERKIFYNFRCLTEEGTVHLQFISLSMYRCQYKLMIFPVLLQILGARAVEQSLLSELIIAICGI